MARPTKLTEATERAILTALRAGMTRTAAFEAAGVERTQISRWMRRFATFRNAVLEAEANAEIQTTIVIRHAIDKGDWKAALAWLERRRRDDWGRVDRIELEIKRAAERIAERTGADPDWLVKRAAEIASGAEHAEI